MDNGEGGHILGKVRDQLEAIHYLTTGSSSALDANRQYTTKPAGQVLFRSLVERMVFQTRIGNPANMLILLKPPSQSNCVCSMALRAQTQSLQTQDQLLRRERIQRRAQIAQDLDTDANGVCNGPECFPKLESMVTFRGLNELRESSRILAPVELTAVDYHATDGGTMTANPFCSTVDDNIGTVIDWASKVATCSEGVVNLMEGLCVSFLLYTMEENAILSTGIILTTNGMPWSWATLAIASKSGTL